MNKELAKDDKYVHGMSWGDEDLTLSSLRNYRKYQFNLISKYLGKNILEVGSGDRGFIEQIIKSKHNFSRLYSIEPSKTFFDQFDKKYKFPDNVSFGCVDLFDLNENECGKFDTIIFIHVLEHIQKDREALEKSYELLEPGGCILIEVPALQFLFSVNDTMLGHFRRYTKKTLKNIVDTEKFTIKKLWYQDLIGVLGSLYFFKIRHISLNSESGTGLVKNHGMIYDKYIIPVQAFWEKFIHFPLGLSLTAVLQKK